MKPNEKYVDVLNQPTTTLSHARSRYLASMLRHLCLVVVVFLLVSTWIHTMRIEAYTETNTMAAPVTPACTRFRMYEATDIGGTGFAPQVLAPSARDCSIEYVTMLPGLSAESSDMARKANKAAAKQDQQTLEASTLTKNTRVELEIKQAKAEVGAS